MLFEEGDAALLKKWIVKRLEDISDADSDVLADYVLALLRHEQGEEEVRNLCVEQLDDFLREHTRNFVDDVFAALRSKSFLSVNSTLSGGGGVVVQSPPPPSTTPSHSQPQPQQQQQQQQQPQQQPQQQQQQPQQKPTEESDGSIAAVGEHRPSQNSPAQEQGQRHGYNPRNNVNNERGQKRSYHDRDQDGGRRGDSQYAPGSTSSRGFKAPRRGGGGGSGDRAGGNAGRWGGRGDMSGGVAGGRGVGAASSPPVGMPFPGAGGFGMAPQVPLIPPGFPWPEDPMATLLAMQAWAGMPGFPPPPIAPPAAPPVKDMPVVGGAGTQRKPVERKVGERCKDYDEKGYCMQGDMCPYEHGMDHIVIAGQEGANDEYDPNNSQLFPTTPTTAVNGGDRGRGRGGLARGGRGGRGTGGTGRGGRSEISGTGPNYDKSNATLVVEHIPEDKLDEASIRTFFSTFGTVTEVGVQTWKKLATVKFERWDMAKKAYDSPAPIFDNRFVKVFWYKPPVGDTNAQTQTSGAGATGNRDKGASSPPPQLSKLADDEEVLDMEEFKRKTEEAQKAHEEKMKKKKEHEEKMKELEKKKEELLKMELEQKKILMEKLAKRKSVTSTTASTAGKDSSSVTASSPPAKEVINGAVAASPASVQSPPPLSSSNPAASSTTPVPDTETEALRAQLEALEAEAKSLGIDHASSTEPYYSSRGGRGAFRARAGAFRGASRGAYHSSYVPPGAGKPYIPGYRGRGALAARARGGGAMRLDNRTRKVSVKLPEEGGDESLREYLFGIGEFESIEKSETVEGAVVVCFKDRLTAEKFVHAGTTIPGIGKVEMAWVNNGGSSLTPTSTSATSASAAQAKMSASESHNTNDVPSIGENGSSKTAVEDYDLADDDEARWLAE